MTHDVSRVPALRADRLGKRYGHAWGLRDCTFEVPPGSIVGLVGPNGAGKTTLLALTVGLLAPTEGQVALFGEPSRAQDAATLARVSRPAARAGPSAARPGQLPGARPPALPRIHGG